MKRSNRIESSRMDGMEIFVVTYKLQFPEIRPEQYLRRNVTTCKEIVLEHFDRHQSGASAKHQQPNHQWAYYAGSVSMQIIWGWEKFQPRQRKMSRKDCAKNILPNDLFCGEFTQNKFAFELS